ncbi:MAG TPA: pilus assembly protein N-terminal domain-containing protein, partial [Stellaceae bacterium]|nr:pilus assembly protein N-terminal domain-containing protein [Stellaceae bacterium]
MAGRRAGLARAVLLLVLACGPAAAAQQRPAPEAASRPLTLDLNKSRVIRLAAPARDVLVANPGVADVLLRSADTAFVVA